MSHQNEISELLDAFIACGENMARLGRLLKEETSSLSEQPRKAESDAESTSGSKADSAAEITADAETENTRPAATHDAAAIEHIDPASEGSETKTYSFAEVRRAAASKSHAGFTDQVKALLVKYGADRLSHVKESDYPAFMHDLGVIG